MKKSTAFVLGFAVVLVAGTASARFADLLPDRTAVPALTAPDIATASTVDATIAVREEPSGPEPSLATEPLEKESLEKEREEEPAEESGPESDETEPAQRETVAKEPDTDTTPPPLVVLHPAQGASVSREVVFEGETEPGARVFVGAGEADVRSDGSWRGVIRLDPGTRYVRVKAKDSSGNLTSVTVEVAVEGAEDVAFTANQKYGEHHEPFEKLWGTAPPGTGVVATSPYGSADTRADASGKWYLPMPFDAPSDTPFEIVVRNGDAKAVFSFVWHAEDVAFTANQKYGSCGEEVPYDVFWGTAAPGSVIEVGSPYGSGTTVAGDLGAWDLRVEFPDAPVGETFEVAVRNGEAGEIRFTFVRSSGGK